MKHVLPAEKSRSIIYSNVKMFENNSNISFCILSSEKEEYIKMKKNTDTAEVRCIWAWRWFCIFFGVFFEQNSTYRRTFRRTKRILESAPFLNFSSVLLTRIQRSNPYQRSTSFYPLKHFQDSSSSRHFQVTHRHQDGQKISGSRNRFGDHLLLCRSLPARKGRDHRQRSGTSLLFSLPGPTRAG